MYGGQPEWGRNLEAAQLVGVEFEKAVSEVVAKFENEGNAEVVGSLLVVQEKRLGSRLS